MMQMSALRSPASDGRSVAVPALSAYHPCGLPLMRGALRQQREPAVKRQVGAKPCLTAAVRPWEGKPRVPMEPFLDPLGNLASRKIPAQPVPAGHDHAARTSEAAGL